MKLLIRKLKTLEPWEVICLIVIIIVLIGSVSLVVNGIIGLISENKNQKQQEEVKQVATESEALEEVEQVATESETLEEKVEQVATESETLEKELESVQTELENTKKELEKTKTQLENIRTENSQYFVDTVFWSDGNTYRETNGVELYWNYGCDEEVEEELQFISPVVVWDLEMKNGIYVYAVRSSKGVVYSVFEPCLEVLESPTED